VTKLQCFARSKLDGGAFIRADLSCVRRCPARADFIELCFETDEGPWTWCFRDPIERSECTSGIPIALTVGPYGAQARQVRNDALGLALPGSDALAMILGGSPTYLARRLVHRNTSSSSGLGAPVV
jgi:hypothetical protein